MTRIIGLLVSIAVSWCSVVSAQTPLRVHVLDVGQGDAVLIQSPSGRNVLYDGGGSPSKIITHLAAANITRIDLVIASHNHADHIGGLPEVIRLFRPRFYLDNGLPATTIIYSRVLAALQAAGTQLLEPTSRRIDLGDGASLIVLPPSGVTGWGQNNNALGLILTFGQFRLSMGGDAERRQWDWWIQHYPELLGSLQVHKASHHGSTNGDTAAAIAILAPEVVIISVGQNNGYGHPSPDALRLYADGGSTTFRTDTNGSVIVEAEESGRYTIRVERGAGTKPAVGVRIRSAPAVKGR